MNIGSIASQLYQQYPHRHDRQPDPGSGCRRRDRPSRRSPRTGPAQAPPAGGLFDALMQALTQSGALTSTTAATSAAGTAATTTDAAATSSVAAGSTSAASTSSTSALRHADPAAGDAGVHPEPGRGAAVAGDRHCDRGRHTAAGTTATSPNTAAPAAADPTSSTVPACRAHTAIMVMVTAAAWRQRCRISSMKSTARIRPPTAAASRRGHRCRARPPAPAASALASLQQSFQNLVSTMGGNSNASLSGFLTNFASDLSGMNAVGNLVNTQA